MYLNGKDLYCEIVVSKSMGQLTGEAQKMLNLLGKRIISKFHYNNPDDRMDCYQNGMEQIYKNWHNFDPDKTHNSFAYFTEVFKRGIAAGWNEVNKGKDKTIRMDGFYEDGDLVI